MASVFFVCDVRVLFSFQIYWRGWRIKGWEWLKPCCKMRIVTLNITGYLWDLFTNALLILLVFWCWCPNVETVLQFAVCLYLLNRKKFCLSKEFLLACLHPWLCMRSKPTIFIILPKWQKFPLLISFCYRCTSHALLISGKYHLLNDTRYLYKNCMWILKPIKVETKNNLSFETLTKTDFFKMSIGLCFEM